MTVTPVIIISSRLANSSLEFVKVSVFFSKKCNLKEGKWYCWHNTCEQGHTFFCEYPPKHISDIPRITWYIRSKTRQKIFSNKSLVPADQHNKTKYIFLLWGDNDLTFHLCEHLKYDLVTLPNIRQNLILGWKSYFFSNFNKCILLLKHDITTTYFELCAMMTQHIGFGVKTLEQGFEQEIKYALVISWM